MTAKFCNCRGCTDGNQVDQILKNGVSRIIQTDEWIKVMSLKSSLLFRLCSYQNI